MNLNKKVRTAGLSAGPRGCTRARRIVALLLVFGLVGAFGGAATPAGAQALSQGKGNLRVMTYNMYAGTNFTEALGARNLFEFLQAVTFTINHVRATNPPARVAAIAEEIAEVQPHLVSLQEVSVWRTGLSPFALQVEFDYVQLLLAALAQRGQHYAGVIVMPEFDFTAPGVDGVWVRSTVNIAILARTDLDPADFQILSTQAAPFQTNLMVTIPGLGTLPVPRSWASADVRFHDQTFRFVATHLEAVSPLIALAQASELVNGGPVDTPLPVIVAADFNSTADDPSDPSFPIYQTFLNHGFLDAWTAANPFDPGFTCCQTPEVNNPVTLLNHRIDWLLTRGGFGSKAADVLGEEPNDRTALGFWPSDHGGVVARLKLPGVED